MVKENSEKGLHLERLTDLAKTVELSSYSTKQFPKYSLTLADDVRVSGYGLIDKLFAVGELVFVTAMTGYEEVLTDPSYKGQIVVFCFPHIGNTGINFKDFESKDVHLAGIVMREFPTCDSNWQAKQSFLDFLKERKIPVLFDVDTRYLTRHLSTQGSRTALMLADSITEKQEANNESFAQKCLGMDPEKMVDLLVDVHSDSSNHLNPKQLLPSMEGAELASLVSTAQPYLWSNGRPNPIDADMAHKQSPNLVVVIDYGVKYNILRKLENTGFSVLVLPAKSSAEQILKYDSCGVVLSNGPGDPEALDWTEQQIQALIQVKMPILGICLGCQLLGKVLGANIKKLKFGHHGINHPVSVKLDGYGVHTVSITSQNHNFCIDDENLPEQLQVISSSLFDSSIQGIRHKHLPIIAHQGHPEASPGPSELDWIFAEFRQMSDNYTKLKVSDKKDAS